MSSSSDPRVYFAAERTLLAWVRTGIAGGDCVRVTPALYTKPADDRLARGPRTLVTKDGIVFWSQPALVPTAAHTRVP